MAPIIQIAAKFAVAMAVAKGRLLVNPIMPLSFVVGLAVRIFGKPADTS